MTPVLKHGEFDWDTCATLAELSAAVYDPEDDFCDFAAQLGYHQSLFFEDAPSDTQAGLVWDDDNVVLIYRGTESIRDWLTDAKFDQIATVEFPGQLHEGFYRSFATSINFLETVEQLAHTRNLFVAGHSLGAALATLSMWHLRKMKPVGYTYGQPRVFDYEGAYMFDMEFGNRLYRCRNNNDVVTRVPPGTRFKHVGQLIYFNRKGLFKIYGKYRMIIDHLLGRLDNILRYVERFRGTDGIVDHFMGAYLPIVNSYRGRNGIRRSLGS